MKEKYREILNAALQEKPADISNHLDSILGDKVIDAIEARKEEVAKSIFNTDSE